VYVFLDADLLYELEFAFSYGISRYPYRPRTIERNGKSFGGKWNLEL
jgi:hypothetical protein